MALGNGGNTGAETEPELVADDARQDARSGDDQQATRSTVLRDALRSRDYDVSDDIDDDALIGQFETWASRAQAIPEDVDVEALPSMIQAAREYEQHRSEFEQWRQSQQRQVEAPQAQQPSQQSHQAAVESQVAKESGYKPDDIALSKSLCRFDNETGMWVPKHPFHGEAARVLNDLAFKAQQTMEQFGIDPDNFIQSRAEKIAEEKARALFDELRKEFTPDIEYIRQSRTQQIQDNFLRPIAAELFTADESGNITGHTPKGRAFDEAYRSAPAALSELEKLQYAKNAADAFAARPQPQAAKPGFQLRKVTPAAAPQKQAAVPQADGKAAPVQPPVDKKKRFIDEARVPRDGSGRFVAADRSGTVNAARASATPQNSQQSSFKRIFQAVKAGELAE